MSLVGDEDEAGCGGVHAVADDCEREAGEGVAHPAWRTQKGGAAPAPPRPPGPGRRTTSRGRRRSPRLCPRPSGGHKAEMRIVEGKFRMHAGRRVVELESGRRVVGSSLPATASRGRGIKSSLDCQVTWTGRTSS